MKTNTRKAKSVAKKVQKPSLLKYLKKYNGWIVLYIFLTLVGCVCDIFLTLFLANLIDAISVSVVSSDFSKPLYLLLTIIGISIVQRVCWYCTNVIYFKYSNRIMADMNLDLAKQAFKLNSKTYNDHDTGTFVQRIVEDPAQIVDNLATVVDVITSVITAIVMLIYIITLNPWIAIALVGVIMIAGAVEFVRVKIRRKNRWIVRKKNDKVHSLTTEIVRSEKDIKSLGLENKLSKVSNDYYEDYRNHRFKLDMVDTSFWSLRNFIINIGTFCVLILGLYLMDKGLLTLTAFLIVYSNRDSLWNVVYGIGNLANYFVNIKVCHKRMFALFDENEFVTEHFGTRHIENLSGEIEFKNVSFTFREYEYKTETDEDGKKKKNGTVVKKLVSENKIFDNLSFKIEPNTTVAFVGKSGSGKSTILNLMSKMYEADSGQVLIDGVDITTLDKATLRSTISLVNQFPYIFDMTIKENLILAKEDATDEEIWDAIKKANLNEFVSSLPKGMDTRVGESGIKLSGGQKQRLAIARALLRNSNIIIFDESTSSLDNFAQNAIKESIDGLKGKSTVVIVAHRLSTIKDADEIFFLDEGKIIDTGTFDELFNRNEKFKTMFLAENI